MKYHASTLLLGLLVATACKDVTSPAPDSEDAADSSMDMDGDGFPTGADCDDLDASVSPGATEICDGVDNDCDSRTDEGVTTTYYRDDDEDGFGDESTTAEACEPPEGHVLVGSDCDDSDPDAFPSHEEVCDGVDNDCNGGVDEDVATTYYQDFDGDGYGAPGTGTPQCVRPSGYVEDGTDCDDDAPSVWPGAEEICGDGLINNCLASLQDAWEECAPSGALGLENATLKLVGEAEYDYAGVGVHGGADVDGDGLGDLLVGAYRNDAGGEDAGAAYLLRSSGVLGGMTGTVGLDQADLKLIGEESNDHAGSALATAGDTDGDGRADVLVGAPDHAAGGSNAGAAYLLLSSGALAGASNTLDLGQADLKLVGEDSGDGAGYALATAGDTDGDGRADVLVGAPEHAAGGYRAGAAYLLLSSGALAGASNTLDLGQADLKLVGEDSFDYAGDSVATAGDVDGDGRADVLVGAPYHDAGGTGAGAAYLLLSSGALAGASNTLDLGQADLKLVGEDSGDGAGFALATAGDTDGDGLDDVLVGAPHHDAGGEDAGATYLLLSSGVLESQTGLVSLSGADLTLIAEAAENGAGLAVATAGDVDADGRADVLVGAPYHDAGGEAAGAAYLLLSSGALAGASGTLSLGQADLKLVGEDNGDYAGFALSAAGDTDGDGFDELLVGAWGHNANAGAAYLFKPAHY